MSLPRLSSRSPVLAQHQTLDSTKRKTSDASDESGPNSAISMTYRVPVQPKRVVDWIKNKYHKNTFFFVVACCCVLLTQPTATDVVLAHLVVFAKLIQLLGLYHGIQEIAYFAHFAVVCMNFFMMFSAIHYIA